MKAAITGWAWRTPLGSSVDGVMGRLMAGERALAANSRFDARSYACTVACAIGQEPAPSRQRRFLRRMGLFALEVAREALAHAGGQAGDRMGVFFGYGGLRAHWEDLMPAFEHQRPDGHDAWERGLKLQHPFWMLQHLSNNAHALAAEELGVRGEGATYGGANAGAQALGAAIRSLQAGALDTALVVAYDSLIEPETLVDPAARGMLATALPGGVASPYDRNAAGHVPGEAAAALVLRRAGAESVRQLACVSAADSADGQPGAPYTTTLERLVSGLAGGGELVDGCGWAERGFDFAEREMLAGMLGESTSLGCIASAFGQLGAAMPLVQAIALASMLRRRAVAPIAGIGQPMEGPTRLITQARPATEHAAIGLSIGTPGLAGAIRIEVNGGLKAE